MQVQSCRICGERHQRYEPHQFTDPKVKFMYESEPSWPAEDQPPAAPEAPHSSALSPTHHTPDTGPAHTPALEPIPSPEPCETEGPDTPDTAPSRLPPPAADVAFPRAPEIPHTTAPLPSTPLYYCGDCTGSPDDFCRCRWTAEQERAREAPEPPGTEADPPLAIVQEVIFDWDDFTIATLDDDALHNLRNLVMAEDMRRRRARKRAARMEQKWTSIFLSDSV